MQSRKRSRSVASGHLGVDYADADRAVIFLQEKGIDALIAACRAYAPRAVQFGTERNLAILYVAVYAGLRVNELHMLDVGDIDVDARVVHVRHGKGSKGRGPKRRTVPLNQDAADAVEQYLALRAYPDPDQPLFVTSRGRMSKRTIQWLVRKLGDDLGMQVRVEGETKRLSPHKLRHTFVSSMLDQGTPLTTVQHYAGHSSSRTTEIYAHAHIGHDAVDALSRRKAAEPTMTDLMANQSVMMEELARLREQLEEK